MFDRFAGGAHYEFDSTHLILQLAQTEGEGLVSRSQAKRIVARLDRFRKVVLDFKGIEAIGPAFADEIFRVFHLKHPDIELVPVNTTEDVQDMIRRAIANRNEQ